jgi:outer membrane protein
MDQELQAEATSVRTAELPIDAARSYSLVELIDLAESHNPETRFAWERARSQAATLGVARSELYPTLAAVALSQLDHGLDSHLLERLRQ